MPHYSIRDSVLWATPAARPAGFGKSRPRGAKAAGLRYERGLAKALPEGLHGQWFQFRDSAGQHYCQPDLILRGERESPVEPGRVVVLEAKYTWTIDAHTQLARLYLPVVGKAWHCRPLGIVICRNLTPETPRRFLARDMAEALELAASGLTPILQWLGGEPSGLRPHFPLSPAAPFTKPRIAA